jgi:starch-binding outer membrane protein, SusD/RagB family
MKRTIILLTTLAMLLTACQDDFLDLTDQTRIPTDNLFTSGANVTAAVNAVYNALLPVYNNSYYVFGDFASDNAYEVVSATQHYFFTIFGVESNNPRVQSMWTDTYKGISRANTVLARADAVQMDNALKARYMGEMKFLRALNYFNLVRIWGDVPLITTDVSDNYQAAYEFGRTPAALVYEQIITDLKAAETALPATYAAADLGRPTSAAVKALLGKVYLTQKKYDLAGAKLGELIPGTATAGPLATANSLVTTAYADVFSTANEMNKEILFAVRFLSGGLGLGSVFAGRFIPRYSGTDIIKVGLVGDVAQRQDLFNAYASTDKRKEVSTAYYTKSGQSDYYTRKYIVNGGPFATSDGDNDWIVLRYSDVLLMYAEAQNEQGASALPYINQVRSRAGLPDLEGLSQANLRLAIETERRLEFSCEGHRWFDLARTDRLLPVMNAFYVKYAAIPSTIAAPNNGLSVNSGSTPIQVKVHQVVFPIPVAEIQYNPKLTQNQGY